MAHDYPFGLWAQQEYNVLTMTNLNVRLLVVDDAPFIREIVRHVAEANGITIVAEAADGAEAVALALEHKPDLILMDLIMPMKNGVEATKEILALLPQTKIIAFSTVDQDALVISALEAGCRQFMVKPFTGEELLRMIKKSMKQEVS